MSFYRDEQFDKLSERWANTIIARERGAAKPKDVSAAFNAMTDYLDARFQAATEAAKATGTAQTKQSFENIEELPLPETNYNGYSDGSEPLYTTEMMRAYGQACAAMARGAAVRDYIENGAEAARQPAPVVAVKTWQERQQEHFAAEMFSMKDDADFMELEIADLRAALAATAAPVLTVSLTTDQKRELLKCLNGGVEMGWIEQNNALEISSSILAGAQDPKVELTDDQKLRLRACIETGVAFEIVTRGDADAILAATNRSQP